MSIYLLEVGTEELPYKFIPQAIDQLHNGFKTFLNDNKVKFGDIKVYATPRRLAVIIDGSEDKTADEEKIAALLEVNLRFLAVRAKGLHRQTNRFHAFSSFMAFMTSVSSAFSASFSRSPANCRHSS